jgi:hypothetical protein
MPTAPSRFARRLGVALLMMVSAAAQADLSGVVNITLSAPGGVVGDATPISLSQAALPAVGIVAGDGGAIGSFMLPGEEIAFVGDSIHIQVAAGSQLGNGSFVSGYLGSGGVHATYELDNLDIAGRQIVGVTVYGFDGFATSGFVGISSPASPASAVHLLTAHSLTLDLDMLVFKDRGLGGSNNFTDFRIDLVSAVPEPRTGWLALAGAGVLGLRLRRSRPRGAGARRHRTGWLT